MSQVNFSEITNYLQSLQKNICTVLTDFDGEESFLFDRWDKSGSKGLQGYGISAVIKNGGVFEMELTSLVLRVKNYLVLHQLTEVKSPINHLKLRVFL